MIAATLYCTNTGRLLAHVSASTIEILQQQCGSGQALFFEQLDLARQCIDLATGEPAAYRPPDPGRGAEWSEAEWRWVPLYELNAPLLAAIRVLEDKQPRALREFVLGQPGAAERLQALDDQIAALRSQLKR